MNLDTIIQKHFKFLTALLGLVILGCGAVVLTTLLVRNAVGDAYVSITLAPTNAKITLNGEEYSIGSYVVKSGKYNVKIEAEGFKTKEFSFEAKNGQVAAISEYLENETEGLKYYERSAADMKALKFIHSKEGDDLSNFLAEYKRKTDIIYSLPLDASVPANTVMIRDGSLRDDCNMAFCLVVEGFTIDKDRVSAVISQKGFKPEEYTIIYDYLKEDK